MNPAAWARVSSAAVEPGGARGLEALEILVGVIGGPRQRAGGDQQEPLGQRHGGVDGVGDAVARQVHTAHEVGHVRQREQFLDVGQRPERRGTPFSALVVGVGNPGREYERSRHNVGFEVVDELARRAAVSMKAARDKSLVAEVHGEFLHYLLAKPMTYVNNSGQAVGPLARQIGRAHV